MYQKKRREKNKKELNKMTGFTSTFHTQVRVTAIKTETLWDKGTIQLVVNSLYVNATSYFKLLGFL